jgi:hypothetical protein
MKMCLVVAMSVRPSVCDKSETTEHICIKLDIGEFQFWVKWGKILGTVHGDLHTSRA